MKLHKYRSHFDPLPRPCLKVPDPVADLRGWFKVVDVDGDGELTRSEVMQALRALLPLDLEALDKAIEDDTIWARARDQRYLSSARRSS